MALSVTVLVSGPAVSTLHETGHTPIRLMRPKVGLRPTRLLLLAGCRTEPAVSVPMENRPRDAATADPEPLLDVPGLMSVFQALRLLTGLSWLWPTSETTLPTSTAPASSSSALDRRVMRRDVLGPVGVAEDRPDAPGGDHLLEGERHAVERPAAASFPHLALGLPRTVEGVVRRHRDEGVEAGLQLGDALQGGLGPARRARRLRAAAAPRRR